MDSLKTTTDIVRYVLLMYPGTRDSDNYLYYRVLDVIGKQRGIDIDTMPVGRFFLDLYKKSINIPSIETVGRCRRKLQEQYPEFSGSKKVTKYREANQERYRAYAKKEVRML